MEKLVNSRLEKLEKDRNIIASILDKMGIEHSGHYLQSYRVGMLAERCEKAQRRSVKLILERKELEQRIKQLEKE